MPKQSHTGTNAHWNEGTLRRRYAGTNAPGQGLAVVEAHRDSDTSEHGYVRTGVHCDKGAPEQRRGSALPGYRPPSARRKISPRPLSAPLCKRDDKKTPLPGKPGGGVFLFGVLFSSWGAVL